MSALKHILVPTDGSQGALDAATFAGNLARDTGARVTLLAVHSEDMLMPYAWGAGEWPALPANAVLSMEEIRASVEKATAENEFAQCANALGEVPNAAERVQLWGHAAEEICRYAVDNGVDLIVMGTRGRSNFSRLLLGSVSTQVANHATCPVTLVR
ncbi:MAG: universal stress protein [Gammaproteobacteria bacterium]|nr:universal stress protein [Gammaproteobacteria bacterium]MCP5201039.1 universal stress protein [Gammaproteobacteria bacterium]